MAIDIIARGLATSLIGPDGKIASEKMPVFENVSEMPGFTAIGHLTSAAQMEGKTAEEILLMMLFGIVNPTLTNPSVKVALSDTMETPIIGRPTVLKGAFTFNRGSISPAYGTSGYRSGAPTKYMIGDLMVDTSSTSYDFEIPFTPTEKEILLPYEVLYAEGEQPLNSAGQPFGAPLSAGSISGTLKAIAMYPLYSAEGEDKEFTFFEDDDGIGYFSNFQSEAATGERQSFAVSSHATVVGVKAFNILTQQWEWLGSQTAAISLTYFDTTIIQGGSLGESENYILYTYNSTPVGARELKIYIE